MLRAWGESLPALCTVVIPFPGRPTQNTLTDGSPREGTIAPGENHPSEVPKHPRDTLPHPQVHRGGTGMGWWGRASAPADPDTLSPGVGVGRFGRESCGAARSAPASTPGAQTWKRKEGQRGTVVAIRGCHGFGGIPSRSLRGSGPFRAGPRKTRSPIDPPGKEPLPHSRTTRRGPQTPSRFKYSSRGRHWCLDPGAGHPPTTITRFVGLSVTTVPPPPPPIPCRLTHP